MKLKIAEYIKKLNPYKAGSQVIQREIQSPFDYIINLASNENHLGVSDLAREAMIEAIEKAAFYPDPLARKLRQALGEMFSIDQSRIVCGHGSESLLAHIVNTFSDQGDEILTASGTFVGIFVSTNKLGREIETVPLREYGFDLDGIAEAIGDRTRIIYLANPNNPTGTLFNKTEFEDFYQKIPEDVLIVLDEAYYAYSELIEDCPRGFDYELPNLVTLRTLSKTHGLAGVRIGFGYGPKELIDMIYKVKLPFEPSVVAQAGAVAALNDGAFLEKTIKENERALRLLMDTFDRLGIFYPQPAANFLMIILSSPEDVLDFSKMCHEKGILVRPLAQYGIPEGVRISTGTIEQTEYAASVFASILGSDRPIR